MINVVTDFGALNNGVGSNYTPFMNALQQAITNGGDEIYFPPGVYKIKGNAASAKPIYKTGINNIKLYGKGAKIVCDTNIDEPGQNGSGGGFTFSGNNITVEDLQFDGPIVAIGLNTYGYGRLLKAIGNYVNVKDCYFTNGNGGAIELAGNYNKVESCNFDKCNNYPVAGADYGSIQISNTSHYISIINNNIINQFYSGICAYDTTFTNNVSYLTINGNYIRSNSSSTSIDHSMGINLKGANQQITISGNVIEKMDAEGIIITSDTNGRSSTVTITDNILIDCDYRGISLESVSINGTFSNYIISNNTIKNTSFAPNADHAIWIDRLSDSIISNNICLGLISQNPLATKGIVCNNSCPRNQVLNNNLSYYSSGIAFFSPNGILANNIVSNSTTGLDIAYCRGASVQGNLIKSCSVGISTSLDAAAQIFGNSVLDCTNRFNTTGSVTPEVLTQTGYATDTYYSTFLVKGVLTAGAATLTFYNVYAEDKFMVIPVNQTTDVLGVLYISSVNPSGNSIQVRSTLASDTRSFFVVKIFSGG